jgi:hypothetical protein
MMSFIPYGGIYGSIFTSKCSELHAKEWLSTSCDLKHNSIGGGKGYV